MKKYLVYAALLVLISGCYYDDKETLYPASNCNTTTVTYASEIKPIVTQNCAFSGCHSGAAPASGLDLGIYTGVQAIALNGKLVGVVNHSSGFSPMPKGSSKLPECNIQQIAKWVADGAPNN